MTFKQSVHIEADVDDVFGYFRDPGNWQELEPEGIAFKDVHLTDEGLGTQYTWVAKVVGMDVEGTNVFTEFVPGQRITDVSSRSFEGTWTYSFEREDSGTKLTLENETRSLWRFPPFSWLLEWQSSKAHQHVLAELKARMEQTQKR